MEKLKALTDQLMAAWAKTEPFRSKTSEIFEKIARVLRTIWRWIYGFRSLILAIPVAVVAIRLAIENTARLPEKVGLMLLASGQYQWMVERSTAVMIPVGVTGACLLLMFLSRRVIYPWVISIFTLILPFVIYLTNVFPA